MNQSLDICFILGHLCPCFSHYDWPSMKFFVGCILSDPVHEYPCDFPLSLLSWNSCCHHVHVNVCSSQTRCGWCFGGLQEPSFPLFLWVVCQGGKQAPNIRTSLSALLFTRLTRFLPLSLLTGWNEWSPLWFHWLTYYISACLLHQFWWSLWGSAAHFKHCPCIILFSYFLLTILIHI